MRRHFGLQSRFSQLLDQRRQNTILTGQALAILQSRESRLKIKAFSYVSFFSSVYRNDTEFLTLPGTSLSKAYDVINRFSEDVDLSLDRAQLGFTSDDDSENPDLSGGKRKALLQNLQKAAEETLKGPFQSELNAAFNVHLDQDLELSIDPHDAQALLFAYPSESKSNASQG